MLRSGFAEQFVEADVLLFIEAERVFIAQRSGLLSGLVCQFSVGIHNIGSKGVRLGRTPGLAERAPLFPVQYYNRPVRKKSPPNGLERS